MHLGSQSGNVYKGVLRLIVAIFFSLADTIAMTLFFELVIVAFLLLISIELLLIYRELVHSQAVRDKGLSEKEDKSAAGQTINVNVASPAGLGGSGFPVTGSVLPGAVLPGAVLAGTASQPNQAKSGADESDQGRGNNTISSVSDRDEGAMGGSRASPYRTGPRSPSAAQTRAANPFAKVCPSCGAENSVYRTECFNCGKAL